MRDVWTPRDLPVLDWLVEQADAGGYQRHGPEEIAEALGIEVSEGEAALRSLSRAEPALIEGPHVDAVEGVLFVTGVTERAYREVQAWPTAESLADRLVARLDEEADREPDPERKGRLRETARYLGGAARDVLVDVTATFAARAAGM